MIALIRQFA
jgi:hypothetical protein